MTADLTLGNSRGSRMRDGPDVCIVANAASGRKGRAGRDALEAAVRRRPDRFELRVLRRGGDVAEAAERAAVDGFSILVAAGGDGTISTVAGIARKHDLTRGVVPMGTFNFFARGLDLPEEVEAALDFVAEGEPRAIGLADINGRVFLSNASLGLYPAILAKREGIYRRWGRSRIAAHWSVLSTFLRFHRPVALEVVVDGETIRTRTPLFFAAHSTHQLDMFELRGAEDVRAGRLGLFLIPDGPRRHLLTLAVRLARHNLREGRDYDYAAGAHVEIETANRERLVARDGERERMRTPFRLSVSRGALRVIAPPEAVP